MSESRLRKPSASYDSKNKAVSETGTGIRIAELSIDAIKALAWPIVALLALIAFYSQLQDIASGLGDKLKEADKVTIGSLSVEIKAGVREVSSDALAEQVGKLSPRALEQLLRIGSGHMGLFSFSGESGVPSLGIPLAEQLDGMYELEKRGFLKFSIPAAPLVQRVRKMPRNEKLSADEYSWHRSPYARDTVEFNEFSGLSYSLTTNGSIARAAIIKTVSTLIAEPRRAVQQASPKE